MSIPSDLVRRLRNARHVVVLTGAGISAESGIPTFRNVEGGLWEHFDQDSLVTREGFWRDPERVWGWYEWLRAVVLRAQPNPAHYAIAALALRVPILTLVTQNMDDLHERAGSANVIHLHGNLLQARCIRCGRRHAYPPGIPDEPEGGRRLAPPRCDECGRPLRPGVVWFGEPLPAPAWKKAKAAAAGCDLFLSIGTSSQVFPVAGLPARAVENGAVVIQVNPGSTSLDSLAAFNLVGPAGTVMPALVNAAWPAL